MAKTRRYQLGHSSLTLIFGNITTSSSQVIVSSDDHYLSMGGGVSAAIRRAGGDSIAQDAAKKVPAQLGDVIVTSAGALPAVHVFHAITIGPRGETLPAEEVVTRSITKCLRLLDVMGLGSIAFPAIGTGAANLRLEEVAASMAESIAQFACECKRSLQIELYLLDRFGERSEVDYAVFFEEFARRVPLAKAAVSAQQAAPAPSLPTPSSTADDQLKERRNHLRRLLGRLDQQRQTLEEQLVDQHLTGDQNALTVVRAKLTDNELLRVNYIAEMRDLDRPSALPSQRPAGSGKTVFLSSTYKDLSECRLKVKDEIHKLRLDYSGMEWFGADGGAAPAAKIVELVRACDVYVGVVGVRYGSIDDATGLSMTELEYQTAIATGKRIHMYVLHDDASVKTGMIEESAAGFAKWQRFKTRIVREHTVFFFRSAEDLARQVASDLRVYS